MSLPLLQTIHALGESLCDALDGGDLDEVARLTAERQAALDELAAAPRPGSLPSPWAEMGEALTVQNRRLADLAGERERELSTALARSSRHRKAHASYETAGPQTGRLRAIHG
jgi:hypothetical protein